MPKIFNESGFTGRFYMADLIPDLQAVRNFANQRHNQAKEWQGLFEGWHAVYTPENRSIRPANSRMQFIPAEFFIGESDIWHVSISWEDGMDEPPVELENRRGLDDEGHVIYLDT